VSPSARSYGTGIISSQVSSHRGFRPYDQTACHTTRWIAAAPNSRPIFYDDLKCDLTEDSTHMIQFPRIGCFLSDDSPHASPNITDEASADTLASTRFEVGYEQLQSSSSNASTTTANRRVRFSILRRRREAASEQRMRLHIITRTNQILPQMADQEASVADRAARTAETTTANRRARHHILRARGPAPRVANHRR
jgi:hypothetical protein